MVNYKKSSFFLLIVALLMLCMSFFNTDQPADLAKVDQWITMGQTVYGEDPAKAIMLWDSAIAYAGKHQLTGRQLQAMNYKMYTAYFQMQFPTWKKLLQQADSIVLHLDGEGALQRDSLSLHIEFQWALYYYSLGLYPLSLTHYELASGLLKKQTQSMETCQMLYRTHQFISDCYNNMGAYDSAIQEAKNSLKYYECYRDKSIPPDFTQPHMLIAQYYLAKGEKENARKYYQSSLKNLYLNIPDPAYSSTSAAASFTKMAAYYLEVEKLDSALYFLEEALLYWENDPGRVKTRVLMGDTYLKAGKITKAHSHYRYAKDQYEKLVGEKSYQLANVNRKIGDLYLKQGQTDRALDHYQQSIVNLALDFRSAKDSLDNPALENILGKLEFLSTLHAKSQALLELGRETGRDFYLSKASETNALAIDLIGKSKYDLIQEEERQLQLSNAYPVFETGLEIEYLNTRQERNRRAFDRAFALSDRSKSLSLLETVRQISSLHGSGTKLLEEENQKKKELANAEQAIFDRLTNGADTSSLAFWRSRQEELKYNYLQWINGIKEKHPDFFQLKFEQEIITSERVQRELLASRQALIEYFWGEEALFTLCISRDTVRMWRQDHGPLRDSLEVFYQLIEAPESRNLVSLRKKLQKLTSFLYQELLAQPLHFLGEDIDHLLVIRDGWLGHLPFELLSLEANEFGQFAKKEFLVNKYVIAYANSAALLVRQRSLDKRPALHFFAGFAPDYQPSGIELKDTLSDELLAEVVRSGYFTLEGAKAELSAIRKVTGGALFVRDQATESNFKKYASDYEVLHLAMHALANNDRPQFSELIFSLSPESQQEDGRLKAIELYSMRLKAQMAVLSACNTGQGKWRRGEGVVSLGHAFTYAGVPSVIMSQWKVPDLATAEIMKNFYQYLKKGQPKDEALTLAKRSFLDKHPEMAHPFFWAGFIAFGDMSPLEIPSTMPLWPWGLLGLLLLLAARFFYRKNLKLKKMTTRG